MKNKKLFLLGCTVILLFLSAGSYILAENNPPKTLFFGPVISSMEGTGVLTSKSAEGSVRSIGGQTEILHFSLDTAQTSLNNVKGKDYVRVEGLKPYGNPGEPMLPFKSFVVTLPINSEVSGVSVSSVSYRPILNKLNIVANPMPVTQTQKVKQTADTEKQIKTSGGKQTTTGKNENKSYNKCKTCDSESFFPGNLVSYSTGQDNNNRYVFIKFFPMQYIPNSNRAILITDAEITVNYQSTKSRGENKK